MISFKASRTNRQIGGLTPPDYTQNLPIFQFCVTYTVMKYKVRLSTVAFVSQDVEVEADSMEDAENKVFENEMWNDEQWNYNRRSSDILEVDDVEVANA